MTKLRSIIVEDLPAALALLKSDLAEYFSEQIEVVGHADTVVAAAKLIHSVDPDLIFLDVELPDGTGFDVLELSANHKCAVIFTTASDQYAIRAFRFAAVDYLLKPIDLNELGDAVARVRPLEKDRAEVLVDHWHNEREEPQLSLVNADEIRKVRLKDIIRCEADNNYTMFHLADGSRFLMAKHLGSFVDLLSPHKFVRTHQSHVVNMQYIHKYVKAEGGYLEMSDKSRVPVAFRRKKYVLEQIKK